MNKFNLPQGLLDSVTNVLKTAPRDTTPLQEKLVLGNQDAVKVATDFDKTVAAIVAEDRKAEAAKQAKFAESAAKAHTGMGKSIVEAIATKEEVVKEQYILDESAFAEIATRMKNVGSARRMQNMTEQKETIAQMTRTFAASFDQIIEANVSAELRDEEAIQEALQAVKLEIRTQMLNAVNVANAARVVDEAAKIMSFISVQEALKGKQHKIDANKNGKIDAHDFEVLKARKARGQGEAVDEAVEQIEEEDKPRSAGSVFDKDVAKSFSKKKPGELTGHESKKTSTGMEYTKKLAKEKEETNEEANKSVVGKVMQMAKIAAKKTLRKVGGGTDAQQLQRLKDNMKEEVEAVEEATKPAKPKAPEGLYSSKRFETDSQRIARLAKEKRQAEKAKTNEEVALSDEEAQRIAQIAKDMGL